MNKAKKIYLSLVFLLIFHSACFANTNLRQKILSNARAQIGNGEIGKNNSGHFVLRYTRGLQGSPWCAAFVSYVLQKSGVQTHYLLWAKSFLNEGIKVLQPLPGDLVIFTRKGGGHIGIVEQVRKDHYISIEGNVGEYPAKVKRIKHFYSEKNFLAFVRIK